MAENAAVTIHRTIPRVPPDLLRKLSGYPSGYFADIQGRRGALDPSIKRKMVLVHLNDDLLCDDPHLRLAEQGAFYQVP